jgi:hypothetical protein
MSTTVVAATLDDDFVNVGEYMSDSSFLAMLLLEPLIMLLLLLLLLVLLLELDFILFI